MEAGVILALSGTIAHTLERQFRGGFFGKSKIAVSRWFVKHIYRLFWRGENKYVFEYDKIRNISELIVLTLASDVVAVIVLVLFFRLSNDYFYDDVFIHLVLISIVIGLAVILQKTRRMKDHLGSQIEFLRMIEETQRRARVSGVSSRYARTSEVDETHILRRLTQLSDARTVEEVKEREALTREYVGLRLKEKGAVEHMLEKRNREFEEDWREPSNQAN